MSTLVTGPLRRSVSPDSFVDITGEGVRASILADALCFDANLTPAQVDAIRARMTSRDDADQSARANLTRLRTAAASPTATTDDVKALALALAAYLLGIETP